MGECGNLRWIPYAIGILRGRAICEKTVDVVEDLG